MATKIELKNRRKSVASTKKITSTMEMVAGVKMKKMQQRLARSKPYEVKINDIIAEIIASGEIDFNDPLLQEAAESKKALIFHITSNRGLCGSYNSNSIDKTLKLKAQLESEGKEVSLYVVGRKGISYYNFSNTALYKSGINSEDKFNFEEAAKICSELTALFLDKTFDEVYISYTKVFTASSQKPANLRLLPITMDAEAASAEGTSLGTDYDFEPDRKKIFSYLLPLYLKVKLFTCFLESAFSEQFLRRVAMKNATDASTEMIRELTVKYNRVRQAKITNEIAEIVGGAAALE